MAWYYSPSTGGFYLSVVHGDAIPTDTVEITAETHAALMQAQAGGKVITADADGRPVALTPTVTAEQLAAAARAKRDAVLTACEWLVIRHRDQVDAGAATTLTTAQYAELLAYRQALRDWPSVTGWPNVDLPTAPEWLA